MRSEPWLEELRAEYARSLPARIEDMRRLAAALSERPSDSAKLDALARQVDRLAGSAGSFGYGRISDTLGPWADLLVRTSAGGGRLAPERLAELGRSLEALATTTTAARDAREE